MGGFVYIHRGSDTSIPRESRAGVNVRHVQYIATRPGAIFNPGCGFGLFGSLKPLAPAENITDLEAVKRLVRAESERGRTLYRGTISLGEPEASRLGYYDRSRWEALVRDRIGVIARELHIKEGDFRWLASVHCNEGHPHTHLIFWDAGKEPREEYMEPPLFRAYTEKVRASLDGFAFGEEIKATQAVKSEEERQLRLELRALCRECNSAGSLDAKVLRKSERLPGIAEKLDKLIRSIPKSGSLRYAYLSPEVKAQVDDIVKEIKELPDFQKQLKEYFAAVDKISGLYGNGEETAAHNRRKAEETLNKALGNELMACVRNVLRDMEADAPATETELDALARQAVRVLAKDSPHYAELLDMLPRDRIPARNMRELPGFQETRKALLEDILSDARVRVRLNAYAKEQAQAAPEVTGTEKSEEKDKDTSAWKDAYASFYKAAGAEVEEILREDAGYAEEARQTHAVETVFSVFRLLSQMTGQKQASASLGVRGLSRDRSREAKKDKAQQASQGEGWEPDL